MAFYEGLDTREFATRTQENLLAIQRGISAKGFRVMAFGACIGATALSVAVSPVFTLALVFIAPNIFLIAWVTRELVSSDTTRSETLRATV